MSRQSNASQPLYQIFSLYSYFYKRTSIDEANTSEAYVLKPNEEVLLRGVIHM